MTKEEFDKSFCTFELEEQVKENDRTFKFLYLTTRNINEARKFTFDEVVMYLNLLYRHIYFAEARRLLNINEADAVNKLIDSLDYHKFEIEKYWKNTNNLSEDVNPLMRMFDHVNGKDKYNLKDKDQEPCSTSN